MKGKTIARKLTCVYCDKEIMSRHIKLYVCDECYIQHMNKG